MSFFGIVIIIMLVYFFIIRPLTQRNRPQIYDQRRGYYDQGGHYGGPQGGGFGRFGSFAGGMAAGALLTYLLDQGRIGFDQFNALQNLEDHEIMRELMDQNIIQEHEIDQLQEQFGEQGGYEDWDGGQNDANVDQGDYNYQDNQNDFDSSDWGDSGGGDNWL